MKRVFIIVLLCVGCAGLLQAAIPAAERQALIDLYNATNGATWTNRTSWRNGSDTGFNDVGTECSWFGVTCNGGGDSVTGLDLRSNALDGSIPPSLKDLSNLESLYLNSNQLSGNLPSELGGLSNLQKLWLEYNEINGSIPPELGNLSNLEDLYLSDNLFSGSIPGALGNLSVLEDLTIDDNQLTGNIPTELGSLSNLSLLTLSANQLSGGIPTELGNLSNIVRLDLSENQLTGPIPAELATPFLLQYLYLDNNQLSGSIPVEMGNMNLKTLHLNDNQLSGSIPAGFGDIYYLHDLILHDNKLTGSIPAELGNCPLLQRLSLYSNQLSGNVPVELGNLTTLYDGNGLDLRWNALHSDDAALITFLNTKQATGNWENTQTIAPENIHTSAPTSSSVVLQWTEIPYTGDSGCYAVFVDPAPPGEAVFSDGFENNDTKWWGIGNPWATTFNKLYTSIVVSGLASETSYDFVVRTITYAHWLNENQVVSEPGETVTETTTSR